MALSKNNPQIRGRSQARSAFLVAGTKTLYASAIVALVTSRVATADVAQVGYVRPYTGAMGEFFLGIDDDETILGDVTVAIGVQPRAAIDLETDRVRMGTPVTGLANDATDVGKLVYATADNVFTLTRPTRGQVVGVVIFPETAALATVRFLTFGENVALVGAGQRELVYLGSYDADTLTTANIRTSLIMGFAGKFISLYAAIDIAPTGGGGTATINAEIDGTNVTGGVVTVATGDAKATVKQGTAITALADFNEASLIDIEAVVGTDMTAGRFDLFAIVERALGT